MEDVFEDKVVLVTGGTGSFGQKFTEILLKKHNPKNIRIYSRGELLQVEMERRLNNDKVRFFIGDVRDEKRLYRAMNGVDIVVHAAALKRMPIFKKHSQSPWEIPEERSLDILSGRVPCLCKAFSG